MATAVFGAKRFGIMVLAVLVVCASPARSQSLSDATLDDQLLAQWDAARAAPRGEAPLENLNVEFVGAWADGASLAVAVGGNLQFRGRGCRLEVIDISTRSAPSIIGEVSLPLPPQGIAVAGDSVYVADGVAGLHIIDISDPAAPVDVATFPSGDLALKVAVRGNYALMADRYNGLVVIDVQGPGGPTQVAHLDSYAIYDIALGSTWAAAAAWGTGAGGALIFDIANLPAIPEPGGLVTTSSLPRAVAVADPFFYVVDGDALYCGFGFPGGGWVWSLPTSGYARDVAIGGSLGFVLESGVGIRTFRANNITPNFIDTMPEVSSANDIQADGTWLYAAEDDGTSIFSYFYFMDTIYWGEESFLAGGVSAIAAVAVRDGLAYVADAAGLFRILDVGDPAGPVEIGSCSISDQSNRICLQGDYAYLTGNTVLSVVDIGTPASPWETTTVPVGSARGVYADGDHAYVATSGSGGLCVVDISVPGSAFQTGCSVNEFARGGVFARGSYAFAADNYLRVFDVSDPYDPVSVAEVEPPLNWGVNQMDLDVVGDLACCLDAGFGLRIADIADPEAPYHVGQLEFPNSYPNAIAADPGYVYMALLGGDLRIVDVTQPTAPVEVGNYYSGGYGADVDADGAFLYVADGHNGLQILRSTLADTGNRPDFAVERLEVAQSVVSSRLIQGKRTVVRAYPRNQGEAYGEQLAGLLHVTDDLGNELFTKTATMDWPRGGVFDDTAVEAGENTINFYLGESETARSELRFWVELDPDGLIAEQDETNNDNQADPAIQQFVVSPALRIGYYSFSESDEAPSDTRMHTAILKVAKTYPVAFDVVSDWQYLGHFNWTPIGPLGEFQQASSFLWGLLQLENRDRAQDGRPALDRLVGFWADWSEDTDIGGVQVDGLDGRVVLINYSAERFAGYKFKDIRSLVAHELGHTYGLAGEYYVQKKGTDDRYVSDDNFALRDGDCPEDVEWPEPCRNHPPLDPESGTIDGRYVEEDAFDVMGRRPAAWGAKAGAEWAQFRVDGDDWDALTHFWAPGVVYGYECGLYEQNAMPFAPLSHQTIGFMGDMADDDFTWIMRDNFELILDAMLAEKSVDKAWLSVQPGEEGHQIIVRAVISQDDAVSAPAWNVAPASLPEFHPTGTGYSLEFLDGGGIALASHAFGLDFGVDGVALLAAVLPYPAGTASIEIRRDGLPIYQRAVSTGSPVVAVVHPNGGETLAGQETVRWTMSDGDGDPLLADVYYAPEVGSNWHLLGHDVAADSLTWQTDNYPGTTNGRIRVVVSDGVNTGQDENDAGFIIGGKPPRVQIYSPADSTEVVGSSVLRVSGIMLDPEDGTAATDSLAWYSDVAGALGVGASVDCVGLAAGWHVIRAEAADSEGAATADSIRIHVLLDGDGDGMPDDWEALYPVLDPGVADGAGDADADMLSNRDEYKYHTAPNLADTDGDGFPDGIEIRDGTDPTSAESNLSAVEDGRDGVPAVVRAGNFPNPFNPVTRIHFSLPKAGHTALKVYDVRGRLVRTLCDEVMTRGDHEIVWQAVDDDGRNMASGIYLYMLEAPDGVRLTRKMAVIR